MILQDNRETNETSWINIATLNFPRGSRELEKCF